MMATQVLQDKPVRSTPLPPWPYFAQDEIDASVRVLQSGKVNYRTGNEGTLFEQEFASYVGSNYALALANGTLALELALYAYDIGPGDEVITTSRTFIASASAVAMRGATPVIADVDRNSGNITAETIAKVLSPKTRAIIAVHLAGWPCDMDPIMDLARGRGIKVIEDCAQAHGARYKGRMAGTLGDMAAFSFCQDKIMTTAGEGGMLVLNDTDLYEKAWGFKDHGKSYDAVYRRRHAPGYPWLHESFGTNWRLSEVQSAVGRCQLAKLSTWLETRKRNAALLTESFQKIPALRVALPANHIDHAYYKYYVYLRPEQLKPDWNHLRVIDAINAEGVFCQIGSCSEIYLEKAFTRAGLGPKERLPVAKELSETAMLFLVHPTLSEGDMQDMTRAVEKVLGQATK
jgi:hypothetical protein